MRKMLIAVLCAAVLASCAVPRGKTGSIAAAAVRAAGVSEDDAGAD